MSNKSRLGALCLLVAAALLGLADPATSIDTTIAPAHDNPIATPPYNPTVTQTPSGPGSPIANAPEHATGLDIPTAPEITTAPEHATDFMHHTASDTPSGPDHTVEPEHPAEGAVDDNEIIIEGRVYCDTCRAGFETSATEYMEGAKVKLECKNYTTGEVVHSGEAVSKKDGVYRIVVHHDYQDASCMVKLVSSSRPDCSEITEERNNAPVVVTANVGMHSDVRHANSLGFLKEKPLASCGQLLMQYALGVDG